jgi:hypothetical protein
VSSAEETIEVDRLRRRARPGQVAIALGAVLGLALGVIVSVTTDVPFAPQAGLVLRALVG